MCGRYSLVPTQKQLDQLPPLPVGFQPSYNIAPTQPGLVITAEEPDQLQIMQWGLIPCWSKDGANSGKLINARSESIADKPSFRTSIRRKRCLVPADSFYEWKTLEKKRKIPFRVLRADGQLLFFAGLWDEWRQGDQIKRTFSIITTLPNTDVEDLHDRMPALLTTSTQQERWLADLPLEETLEMLGSPKAGLLRLYQVPELLNSPRNNGPELHQEVPEQTGLFA